MRHKQGRQGTGRQFLDSLVGRCIITALRVRHRRLLQAIYPLADHLAQEVFPGELASSCHCVKLELEQDGRRLLLTRESQDLTYALPGSEGVARALNEHGVRLLRLDARLDGHQIVEAMLVFLFVANALEHAAPSESGHPPWTAAAGAAAMLGSRGLHRFCCILRYDRETKRLCVEHSYCELFFSRLVTRWSQQLRGPGHRALFVAALPTALAVAMLSALEAALAPTHPWAAMVLGIFLAVAFSIGAGAMLYTLGSILYDREQRDLLLAEALRKASGLAHFPATNPNPVFKLDRRGGLIYANPAARHLLREMTGTDGEHRAILPDDLEDWIAKAEHDRVEQREVRRSGRTLRYRLSRFPDEPAVLVAGDDVTELAALQEELRLWNAQLEQRVAERTAELQQTQDVTIQAMTALAETRDPSTGAHIERTRLYVKVLADHLRYHPRFLRTLDDDRLIDLLYRSAPLHDIGKVGTPDRILLKPGPLTPEEFEEMKRHAEYGGDAIRRAESRLGTNTFLHLAGVIAYTHHEHWDGTGYPKGLAGEDIPVPGRLMAMADVYDALVTKRVYKDAMSHDQAAEIILAGRGSHFDPAVTDAFLETQEVFQRIAADNVDPANGNGVLEANAGRAK